MHYKANFKQRENNKAGKMTITKEVGSKKMKIPAWHGYIYPKSLEKFDQMKLSSMELCSVHPNLTLNDGIYHSTTFYSWVKQVSNNVPYPFYAGIINSSLFWWFLKHTGDTLSSDTRRMKTNYLNPFPLPSNVTKAQQDELTNLVTQVMALKKSGDDLSKVPTLEAQIDDAVFDLYALSSEERVSILSSIKP
jgi:hypothetical protein